MALEHSRTRIHNCLVKYATFHPNKSRRHRHVHVLQMAFRSVYDNFPSASIQLAGQTPVFILLRNTLAFSLSGSVGRLPKTFRHASMSNSSSHTSIVPPRNHVERRLGWFGSGNAYPYVVMRALMGLVTLELEEESRACAISRFNRKCRDQTLRNTEGV